MRLCAPRCWEGRVLLPKRQRRGPQRIYSFDRGAAFLEQGTSYSKKLYGFRGGCSVPGDIFEICLSWIAEQARCIHGQMQKIVLRSHEVSFLLKKNCKTTPRALGFLDQWTTGLRKKSSKLWTTPWTTGASHSCHSQKTKRANLGLD